MDPYQGGGQRRRRSCSCRGCGAVPIGLRCPVAGCRGRSAPALVDTAAGAGARTGAGTAAQAAPPYWHATMTALELRAVSKRYGEGPAEVQALRGVDLLVDEG